MTNDSRLAVHSHNVIMEDRKSLSVSGVTEVDSFDEQTVVLHTHLGELTIKGNDLHIEKLNTDSGDVALTGSIYGLMYTTDQPKSGFWGRVFR